MSSLDERFWSKVDKAGPDKCWEWTGAQSRYGYGQIKVDGKSEQAHRIASLLVGKPPGDMHVLHHCDNPPCVNPAHLYRGTHADNMRDVSERSAPDHAGEKHPQAKLSADDVKEIRRRVGAETQAALAEEFGVTQSHISHISNGNTWG